MVVNVKEIFLEYFDKNIDKSQRYTGFTLAEVLITLGIIGIVAAMTIPTLVNNSQKKSYVTQLKKFYATQNNGWKELLASDGVEKLGDTNAFSLLNSGTCYGYQGNVSGCTTFWSELKKYFKFDFVDAPDTYQIYYLNGGKYASTNGEKFMVFPDGSMLVYTIFYKYPVSFYSKSSILAQGGHFFREIGYLVVDVNGFKKPNTHGRDIFTFYLSDDGNLYPMYGSDYSIFVMDNNSQSWQNQNGCARNSNNSDISMSIGQGCAARIMESGWEMDY